MASLRQIKRRMKSVENIHEITAAMEMIAAFRFKKAEGRFSRSRAYLVELEKLGLVVERFTAELAGHRFGLLEALAEHLAGIVTGELGAPWVRISVAKLGHIRNVRKVGVTIERSRPGKP